MAETTQAPQSITNPETESSQQAVISSDDTTIPAGLVDEEAGDETDAVLAVVAAVELAAKSGDGKTTSTTSTPVKRKAPSKNTSSSSPASGSLSAVNLSDSAKRRKKDPSAPKAPLNGYLVYFNEERAGMRAQNPNIGFGELTKIIAAKWKELPTEQKQKYINEADHDKERYEKEMASYKKSDAYKQFLKGKLQSKIKVFVHFFIILKK